jgi:hypothetical protein
VIRWEAGTRLELEVESERCGGRRSFQLAFVKTEDSSEEAATRSRQAAELKFSSAASDGSEAIGAAFGGDGGAGQGLSAGTDDAFLNFSGW